MSTAPLPTIGTIILADKGALPSYLSGASLAVVVDHSEDLVIASPANPCDDTHAAAPSTVKVMLPRRDDTPAAPAICLVSQRIPIPLNAILERRGVISPEDLDALLRAAAHLLTATHYRTLHQRPPFAAGETRIPYGGRVYDETEMCAAVDAALDFWLTEGRFAQQMRKALADFLGVKHCLLTTSGSSANLLAISALTSPKLGDRRLKPGDEVITAACGFPTTVTPIIQNQLIPVFVDVDLRTGNVDVAQVEQALSEKTRAIFLAHTLGNPFDLSAIAALATKHDLWLVEDNCDALGSRFDGRLTGSFGHLSTMSFYPPHHITTGEGGAIATRDPDLKRIVESFRDWGRDCYCEPGCDDSCGKRFGWQLGSLPKGYDHKYTYSHLGYNMRMTEFQAAIGCRQLEKLPAFVAARQSHWQQLRTALSPYGHLLDLPEPTPQSDPAWFGFLACVKKRAPFSREAIVRHLEDAQIMTRMLFAGNMTRQPCFEQVEHRVAGSLAVSDHFMNDGFWIGVYPGLTNDQLDYMAATLTDFLSKQHG